jgi:hypothetical protein
VCVHVGKAGHDVLTGGIDDTHAARIDLGGRRQGSDLAVVDNERVVGELSFAIERQRGDVRERERPALALGEVERAELR